MNICVIYGGQRKESTYHCVDIFKQELMKKVDDVEFVEFVLPKNMPHLCLGCFSCMKNGEDTCPHAEYVQPIAKTMLKADGIIISSPVHACDASGSIKALYDHLCYMWVPHRPQKEMLDKVVMVITTTAGAGARTSVKTLKKSPRYWCVKRVYGFGMPVAAAYWKDVNDKKRNKIHSILKKRAKQFIYSIQNKDKLPKRLMTGIMFTMMANMVRKYQPDNMLYRDREHWEKNGWL